MTKSSAWKICCIAVVLVAGCADDGENVAPAPDSQQSAPAAPLGLRTDSIGLIQQTTGKGTSVQLDGRFQRAVLVRREADGSFTTGCHDSEQEAAAFLDGANVAPTQAPHP